MGQIKNQGKVTVYTQVYNSKKYIGQCIESVLSQTYSNLEYIIMDNGCTDGCSDILRDYAHQDKRIVLLHRKVNERSLWMPIISRVATGDYFSALDSDDWWEPDYLERLVNFLERNHLGLAVTGTVQYLEKFHADHVMRKLEQPVIMTQYQFAQNYPSFWIFPSTSWGSILKMELFRTWDVSNIEGKGYPFGVDTMVMLQYVKQCSCIGIDNSALYHYRIHPQSISYQYDPRRFDANVACYEQIKEFLEYHRTFDPPKQEWLKLVHLSSMRVTLELLRDAQVAPEVKLAECTRIVEHPLTAAALTHNCTERGQWFSAVWENIFNVLAAGKLSNTENLYKVLQVLSPKCCGIARAGDSGVFAKEAVLREALQRDDWERMICYLMQFIVQRHYSKQYNLGQMLCSLIPPGTPLEGMSDTRFFREYSDICMLILSENYFTALEQMTGRLLEEKKPYAMEAFLKLYLSLAALEEQVPAFLFGKLQLARFYLQQGRLEDCRLITDELAEMGLDNAELSQLRQALEEI